MNATPSETTSGLWMAVSCPTCGGPVHVTNPGCTNGRENKTIVRCPKTGHGEWLITARISQAVDTAYRP